MIQYMYIKYMNMKYLKNIRFIKTSYADLSVAILQLYCNNIVVHHQQLLDIS